MRDAWWDLVHGGRCCSCGRPGRTLCVGCLMLLPSGAVPAAPDPCPAGLAPCVVAGDYADPLRSAIVAHKERAAHALARPLGALLAGVVAEGVSGHDPVVLVPLPSRPAVVRARGHDPVLRVTRHAAALLRHRRPAHVLRLLRNRLPVADQTGLGAVARAENLADSLAVRSPARSALLRTGGRLLLCDDVITTGATVREGQRALESSGLSVDAIVCLAATRRRSLPISGAGD